MKKILLSAFVVFTFLIYSLRGKFGDDEASHVIPPKNLAQQQTQNQNSNPTPQASPNSVSTQGNYKDGSYTGDTTDAFYGNVQVKVVIKNGSISDVQFLQYPNDRSTSVEINSQAMPYLTQEALQVQDANVDIVSGATQTSLAFRQSLASALQKAK